VQCGAEQRRIDALMALCDRLETSLRAQRVGHEAVAAAFARALAGASSAP
jgi:hypothetical protein